MLRYFAKPEDTKPKGVLPLDGAEILDDVEQSKSKKVKSYSFQLKVPGRSDVFDCQAENDKEKVRHAVEYARAFARQR